MNKDEIQKQINSFPYWYHTIELPYDIVTPGFSPISAGHYQIPEDFSGKRVLDIGAWDGYWTFEALKRGAKEVVAIDDFSDLIGQLEKSDRKEWETFDFCRQVLGYSETECQRLEMNVYDISIEKIGTFDYVFMFGLVYHLRYPLLALDKISEVCTNKLFIESAILDDFSPYHGGLGNGYPGKQNVMEFYPGSEYGQNNTNWWVPTLNCLAEMTRSAGFTSVKSWKLTDHPTSLPFCRGFVHGIKTQI